MVNQTGVLAAIANRWVLKGMGIVLSAILHFLNHKK